ncbi:MAG: MSMEG_1061 family FMN-dependent PPOX-type flavoprotein [Alphaproteobacteria bacterium]
MGFDQLATRFAGMVTSHEDLSVGSKGPSEAAANKVIDHLDDHCIRFIGAAPFVVLGSRSRQGWMDVSPKGDPGGFVQILDKSTLAIPDRLGNNRHDTLHNLIDDPALGLIFLVPDRTETLRVSGRARIVRDEALCQSMAMNGKAPKLAIVMAVERVLYHCGKCMIRSNLWKPEAWPDVSGLSSLAAAVRDHAKLAPPVPEIERYIDENYRTELY